MKLKQGWLAGGHLLNLTCMNWHRQASAPFQRFSTMRVTPVGWTGQKLPHSRPWRLLLTRSSIRNIPKYHRAIATTRLKASEMKPGSHTLTTSPLASTASLPREKIRLQGVEQTMLATVFLKYRDAKNDQPILGDPYAAQLLERCDINMDDSHFKHLADERYVQFILSRTKRLDQWCQDFIDTYEGRNEPVTILHLGCGLDCRHLRVRRGPNVRWIDLDRPLAVDLRNRLMAQSVNNDNVNGDSDYVLRTLTIGSDESWLRDIPADRPTLVIAEGLLYYLQPAQTERTIHDIVEYFGHGELLFDSLGYWSVKLTSMAKFLKTSKTAFLWWVEEPEQIEALHPNLRVRERVKWKDFMESHPPFFGSHITPVMSLLPSFTNNIQFWRWEFQKRPIEGNKQSE
ncbi:S-adenosyl-L-methionine-dependent methyltransferase [Xylariales sp. PMI_506]|nr:S-adenosyl-L-methionine-dependent methyltransferase [Xylariales sp. PMI_506]